MDATTLQYATQLSNGDLDQDEAPQFYTDALTLLNGVAPTLVKFATAQIGAGSTVALPGDADALLLAFWNRLVNNGYQQIGELSVREANYLLPNWRDQQGTNKDAYNFVREGESEKTITLVPASTISPPTTTPNVGMLVSYSPQQTLPEYVRMIVALLMLEANFSRESTVQNVPLAKACRALANLLLSALLR